MSAALIASIVSHPMAASATVRGPCEISVGDSSITVGHNTPSTALRVSRDSDTAIEGSVGPSDSPSGIVEQVRYGVELLGGIIRVPHNANGSSWRQTLPISGFAWASIGLFLVRVEAGTSRGICTGEFFVCVTGNPFLTLFGGAAIVMLAGGALLVFATVRDLGRSSGLRRFVQPFAGETLLVMGLGLLLHQACRSRFDLADAVLLPVVAGLVLALSTVVAVALKSRAATGGSRGRT